MAKKAFPKEVFVWRETERDGDEFLMVAESLEEACQSLSAGDKREIGTYSFSEDGKYTLRVQYVPKGSKV